MLYVLLCIASSVISFEIISYAINVHSEVRGTVERRLSGGGLTGGRLNREHKCDSCSNVQRTFAAIVKWATSLLCSFVLSSGIFEIHFCS